MLKDWVVFNRIDRRASLHSCCYESLSTPTTSEIATLSLTAIGVSSFIQFGTGRDYLYKEAWALSSGTTLL